MQTEIRDPRSSHALSEARLLADLASRRPSALAEITTRFGRQLTGIAYLVLQHHDGAADAVARGIADIWRRADDPNIAPDVERLRRALLGATARRALLGHAASRTVDPATDGGPSDMVSGLSPPARAAFGLRYAAGLPEDVVAELLAISPRRVRRLLEPAAVRPRLPAAVKQLAALPVTVDPDRVRAALARASDSPVSRRRWVAVPVFAAAVLLLRLALTPGAQPPAGDLGQRAPSSTDAVRDASAADPRAEGRRPTSALVPAEDVPPFTLADCDIEPASSPIAFAGWVTVEEIRATGVAPAGQTVYAIVTRSEAEWIGYRYSHDRPLFPRPVGRLGCLFDPGSGGHVAVGVAQSWEPPSLADGCPASPVSTFAGYRELGGPGAFVLIDTRHGWWANDPELSFLTRIAPAPAAGARVEAWLQPTGEGPRIQATVDSPGADAAAALTSYVRVDGVEIPEPGCWILNVAVDGTVVGSAILPIAARSPPVP